MLPRLAKAAWCAAFVWSLPLAAAPSFAHDKEGFLYGTVKTSSDRQFTGVLRWGDEETFWDDLFNATKKKTPFLEEYADEKSRERTIEVFGKKLKMRWGDHSTGRQFVVRFGDMAKIEARQHHEATLTMQNGDRIEVEGSSNDLEAKISIWDSALGKVEVPWNNIREISFRKTPSDAATPGSRLRGTVETEEGTFKGFIQWDKQECLSIDKLDGEEDGIEHSIEMGQLQSIERRGRGASRVVLRDGRSFVLEGTNDVDDDNRGILVEDDRYGRVEVKWDAFRKLTFDAPGASGKSYESYAKQGPLRGRVIDISQKGYSGRIVFDLDEENSWEMLDGDVGDVSYSIPFSMIESITPRGTTRSSVKLRGGTEIVLADGQDVSESNDGVLVLTGGDKPTLVRWADVASVVFEP